MPGVVSERKKPSIRNRVLWSRGLDYLNRTRPNDGTCPGIMPAAIRLVHCTMVSRQPRRERAKPRVGRFRKRLEAQRSNVNESCCDEAQREDRSLARRPSPPGREDQESAENEAHREFE